MSASIPFSVPRISVMTRPSETERSMSRLLSYVGHDVIMCSRVWMGTPHGQEGFSGGTNEEKYSPKKACPVRHWIKRPYVLRRVSQKCLRGLRVGGRRSAGEKKLFSFMVFHHCVVHSCRRVDRDWRLSNAYVGVVLLGGKDSAASLARTSALSFPSMLLCPGIQDMFRRWEALELRNAQILSRICRAVCCESERGRDS